jgi:hypothetical protein
MSDMTVLKKNTISVATLLLLLMISLTGCDLVRAGVAALRSTDDFKPIESDKRVLAEPGAEDLAKQVAGYLPEAIAIVERAQVRDFTKPVQIYVCASEGSFASHTGASKNASGAVTTKLFFSKRLAGFPPEQVKARVIHELSHLHFEQQLGAYGYDTHIPAWFQEGLAVVVSNGGGAEKVSEAEAIRALLAGTRFVPEPRGSFFFKKTARSYGLEPHLFYRQASLFVGYLKEISGMQFGLFLLALEDGRDFEKAFRAVYGMTVNDAWQEFLSRVKEKQKEMHFAFLPRDQQSPLVPS